MKSIVYLLGGMLITFSVYVFFQISSTDIKKNQPLAVEIVTLEKNEFTTNNVYLEAENPNIELVRINIPLNMKPKLEIHTQPTSDENGTKYKKINHDTNVPLVNSDIEVLNDYMPNSTKAYYTDNIITILGYLSLASSCDTDSFAIEYNRFTVSYTYIIDNLSKCSTKSPTIPIKQIYAIFDDKIVFEVSLDNKIEDKNRTTKFKFKFSGKVGELIHFLFIREDDSFLKDSAIIR